MISSKRTSKARAQGAEACRRTRGVHKLTLCRYYKFTAQNLSFSGGWSEVWNVAHKFWAKSHTATKTE
jgi:hypothetical protein